MCLDEVVASSEQAPDSTAANMAADTSATDRLIMSGLSSGTDSAVWRDQSVAESKPGEDGRSFFRYCGAADDHAPCCYSVGSPLKVGKLPTNLRQLQLSACAELLDPALAELALRRARRRLIGGTSGNVSPEVRDCSWSVPSQCTPSPRLSAMSYGARPAQRRDFTGVDHL